MGPYNLLLVDDEDGVVNALVRTLHDEGYVMLTSKSAEAAVGILRKNRIDLIIADYALGRGMNGLDFLERAVNEQPAVIAILLTGQASPQVAVDAVNRARIRKLIVKPWNDDDLKRIVRESLEEGAKGKLKILKAKEIMSKFAITISEDDTLLKAAHLMMRFKISGLPALSKEGGMAGIITATDLFRVMGENLDNTSFGQFKLCVKDVMTRQVCVVGKEASLVDVISLMCGRNIHTLPVVEGGEIVGIIGRRDVLNHYYSSFTQE